MLPDLVPCCHHRQGIHVVWTFCKAGSLERLKVLDSGVERHGLVMRELGSYELTTSKLRSYSRPFILHDEGKPKSLSNLSVVKACEGVLSLPRYLLQDDRWVVQLA